MAILVGVDGTDSELYPTKKRDIKYDKDFANSFVKRICNAHPNSKYFRGPVAGGGGMPEAIWGGFTFIEKEYSRKPNESVLLTGYSRGAAATVGIAKKLKEKNIKVRALLMFDCVDRWIFGDAADIPNNVEYVCHVIRNPATLSRSTFGNDGMRFSPPTNYPKAVMFMCTHGAMGGVPWAVPAGKSINDFVDEGALEAAFSPSRTTALWNHRTNVTYAQDAAISRNVWQYVQPFLKKYGF